MTKRCVRFSGKARKATLLLSQSSLQSFPKNELGLRSSYPVTTRKCPKLDQISSFMLNVSPNAWQSVHSTQTVTVCPFSLSDQALNSDLSWLHSKLWDPWSYLSHSFSFVTRRYSFLIYVCMYVCTYVRMYVWWVEMKFRLLSRYKWSKPDLLLFGVKRHFPG